MSVSAMMFGWKIWMVSEKKRWEEKGLVGEEQRRDIMGRGGAKKRSRKEKERK